MRHRWADEIIYYAERGQIERRQFCATTCKWGEWRLTDRPNFHESTSDFRIPQPKLYQARVEIPRPLTVEEAMEADKVFMPTPSYTERFETYTEPTHKRICASRGIAYRTPEEAIQRAEAMLKVEEE